MVVFVASFLFRIRLVIRTTCHDEEPGPRQLPHCAPLDHLKLQVRNRVLPRRLRSPPRPLVTFDLVTLTDTLGRNVMQRYFGLILSKQSLLFLQLNLEAS